MVRDVLAPFEIADLDDYGPTVRPSNHVDRLWHCSVKAGNGHTFGRHEWVVPADAPAELFYQSGLDDQVFGKIIVVD